MIPLFVPIIFKIAGKASVVESLSGKVAETSVFWNSVDKSKCAYGMFRKKALLEISRGSLLTEVAGLQYTVCNATKNELD